MPAVIRIHFAVLWDNYADYMSINVPFINSKTRTRQAAFDCGESVYPAIVLTAQLKSL